MPTFPPSFAVIGLAINLAIEVKHPHRHSVLYLEMVASQTGPYLQEIINHKRSLDANTWKEAELNTFVKF